MTIKPLTEDEAILLRALRCEDCRWREEIQAVRCCTQPEILIQADGDSPTPVRMIGVFTLVARTDYACGPDGNLFQPKEHHDK